MVCGSNRGRLLCDCGISRQRSPLEHIEFPMIARSMYTLILDAVKSVLPVDCGKLN